VQPLDNPVWHALTGPQATVAEGTERARRYGADYSVFAALPDEPDAAAWEELRTLVGADGHALLVPEVTPPADWERLGTFAVHQMVLTETVTIEPAATAVRLGPDDVDAMGTLISIAQPGPWAARTHELGDFFGVRDSAGRLVAMAGQRMHLEHAVEISAVACHPDARGNGYAAAAIDATVAAIAARGRLPFLHVRHDNVAAIRVYERLGFTVRTTFACGMYQAQVRSGA
jgi:ribosomal protein S18 acetylase RimI-like enzyme